MNLGQKQNTLYYGDNLKVIRELYTQTKKYHEDLIELSRSISKIEDLLSFVVLCIDFSEKSLPEQNVQKWSEANKIFPELSERSTLAYSMSPTASIPLIHAMENTAGSAVAYSYSFILNNHSFLESNDDRSKFRNITQKYQDLIFRENQREELSKYLILEIDLDNSIKSS